MRAEKKILFQVDLTPSWYYDNGSIEAEKFGLLLNYVVNKKVKHLMLFPKIGNQLTTELNKEFNKIEDGINLGLDWILNNKDELGFSIWAALSLFRKLRFRFSGR